MDKPNYKALLPQITTFIFDVDGVLTNGKVLITSEGEMYREMDTKDGYALKCALDQGFKVYHFRGTNEGVRNRLRALGIYDIYLGAHHKGGLFKMYWIVMSCLPMKSFIWATICPILK